MQKYHHIISVWTHETLAATAVKQSGEEVQQLFNLLTAKLADWRTYRPAGQRKFLLLIVSFRFLQLKKIK